MERFINDSYFSILRCNLFHVVIPDGSTSSSKGPYNLASAFKVVPRDFQEESKTYQFTLGGVIRHPVFLSCHEIMGDTICRNRRAEGSRKAHSSCCGGKKTGSYAPSPYC